MVRRRRHVTDMPVFRTMRSVTIAVVVVALWMAFATPLGAQTDEPTVVLCNEATGEIVELPEWIAEGALHFPAHPATEAEIAAGECAVTAPEFGEGNGGNGVVTLPVPTAVDPVSCGHFETQADAQAYFDSTELDDPSVLDPDGDGIACEFRFGEVNGGTEETPASFEPQTSALLINKHTCPSLEAAQAEVPRCELGDAGIRFEVMTTDGAEVGACVTEVVTIQTVERAACWVENVPLGTVVVTEDVSTLPPGTAPLTESQTVTVRDPSTQGPDYINTAVFYNVPVVGEEPPTDGDPDGGGNTDGEVEGGDTGTGVVQLPDTGTGNVAPDARY
ncbi:MAG TPA: excalibur calcium-binding domain-containing protein, partial [Thermomicrobiales bacterium]|nr:excalibur calcium-binding domain-containing protein [Thermomicrobiales bacterium]